MATQYKAKLNIFTGQLQLVPTNIVLAFKAAVATQASLPLSGNAMGDARIANDTGNLYVWNIESATGLLTDWIDAGDIVDLEWDVINGKPSSTPVNIDSAVSLKHTRNADTKLDEGGANEISASEVTKKLTADRTYYINCDTGSNSNPGTSGSPFQTIVYALSLIPKNLNGYAITIRLQNSLNYSEALGTELSGFSGGKLEIRSDSANPSNALITLPVSSSKKGILEINKISTYVLINRISFRVNANNKRCIGLGENANAEIYGCKFGDTGNTGTTGIYLDTLNPRAKIVNCSDIDSNKVAVGIDVKAGGIAVISDSVFGDVNFPVGAGDAGSIYLITNVADGKLQINANDYNDILNKKHSQNTDQYLDYGGANQLGILQIARISSASISIYVDPVSGLDTNSGTIAEPVQTIAKAIDLCIPGVPKTPIFNHDITISLRAGTYTLTSPAVLRMINGGGQITLAGYLAESVLLTGSSADLLDITDCNNNIKIRNINFRVTANDLNCIDINNARSVVIESCNFGDAGNTGTVGVKNYKSLVSFQGTCGNIDANKVATGARTTGGGITSIPESTDIGDVKFVNETSGVVLNQDGMTLIKSDYDDAVSKKHAQNTDDKLCLSSIVSEGNSLISRDAGVPSDWTIIDTNFSISNNGNLTKVQIYYDTAPGNIKFKIFRQNGLYFDFIGETPLLATTTGINEFTLASPIAVLAGDFIGVYNSVGTGSGGDLGTSGGTLGTYDVGGDIAANKLISEFTPHAAFMMSVACEVTLASAPTLIDNGVLEEDLTITDGVKFAGNVEVTGELKIKVYSQNAEPILTATSRMAIWIDTDDNYRTYLIFRRNIISSGLSEQVKRELI